MEERTKCSAFLVAFSEAFNSLKSERIYASVATLSTSQISLIKVSVPRRNQDDFLLNKITIYFEIYGICDIIYK